MLNTESGVRTTGQNTGSLIRDVDDKVWFLNAQVSPLMSLLKKVGKSDKTSNVKFEWYEKSLGTFTTAFAGSTEASPQTTIDITTGDGAKFRANDLLFAKSTGEQMLVTSISGDTLTVIRGYGEVSSAILTNGDTLYFLGNAFMEHTEAPESQVLTSGSVFNYPQIFKDAVELSRREMDTERYDEKSPQLKEKRKEMFLLHMEKINRTFWQGQRKDDTSGSSRRTLTRGALNFINTNVVDCGGSFTRTKMNSLLKAVFDHGIGNKYLFVGSDMMDAMDTEFFTNGNVQLTPGSKEFGLDIRTWISPYGRVKIAYDQVLSQMYSDYGALLDFDTLKERYMLKTKLFQNIKNENDPDGVKDEYKTDIGLQMANEEKSGIIKIG